MKPAPFEYVAPATLDEALDAMAAHGYDAKLLAGGQSLIPVMNFRLAQPAVIVDLNGLAELQRVHTTADTLHIGAMVRQSTLEHSPDIRTADPLLAETMPHIAHSQIRNRGTLGGSLAHADPAGELPVIAVAREARLRLQRKGGERWVTAETFYEALFTTALQPDEILTDIAFPAFPARTGWAFQEMARRHGDYAQAGVAALITLAPDGTIARARIVYLNLGEIPMVAAQAAAALLGQRPTADLIDAIAHQAAQTEIDPTGDIHATAAYKRHLAHVLGKRVMETAVERANALNSH